MTTDFAHLAEEISQSSKDAALSVIRKTAGPLIIQNPNANKLKTNSRKNTRADSITTLADASRSHSGNML
jgi:hypothetical protein